MERDEIEGIGKLNSPEKKKEKEKRRRKHKPDEVKEEMVVDAIPKEEENLKSPEKGSPKKKEKRRHKHKHKPKPDGAQAVLKEEEESNSKSKAPAEGEKKRKKKKLVTVKLSDELMGYLRTKEVMPYLARETPRPLPIDPGVAQHMFVDQELRQEIAAQVHENREFDAFVLYQYRTKGYAEIQQEVTDDDDDDDETKTTNGLPAYAGPGGWNGLGQVTQQQQEGCGTLEQAITAHWSSIGLTGSVAVTARDLWAVNLLSSELKVQHHSSEFRVHNISLLRFARIGRDEISCKPVHLRCRQMRCIAEVCCESCSNKAAFLPLSYKEIYSPEDKSVAKAFIVES
uniref:Uncharacterized protein n=1 Tax=Oryza rufipogon TaxID=4529 RepID=A0A0E0R0W7_ORYRU